MNVRHVLAIAAAVAGTGILAASDTVAAAADSPAQFTMGPRAVTTAPLIIDPNVAAGGDSVHDPRAGKTIDTVPLVIDLNK